MKAVQVQGFGEVDQLQVVETPTPVPGPGEVLLRVHACGLNFADLMQREGLYLGGPIPPFFPGTEAAGTVVAHGPEVTAPLMGARVTTLLDGGAQAEYAVASASACIALPENLSFVEGAAFPVQYLTAYHALTTVARAQPGETVLVHAAAGGVGTAAVQIARLLGLRVMGTASTAEKRERVQALGADLVVDYASFGRACRRFTGGHGPDIVLETIGGDVFDRSLAMLAPLGRLVVIGLSSKQAAAVDTAKLLFQARAVLGFHLSAVVARPALVATSLEHLIAWLRDESLTIQVGHIFPLAEIRRAHDLLASRASYGKVVLEI